jgi:hypothetical protein
VCHVGCGCWQGPRRRPESARPTRDHASLLARPLEQTQAARGDDEPSTGGFDAHRVAQPVSPCQEEQEEEEGAVGAGEGDGHVLGNGSRWQDASSLSRTETASSAGPSTRPGSAHRSSSASGKRGGGGGGVAGGGGGDGGGAWHASGPDIAWHASGPYQGRVDYRPGPRAGPADTVCLYVCVALESAGHGHLPCIGWVSLHRLHRLGILA